jgi:hypothetical protein
MPKPIYEARFHYGTDSVKSEKALKAFWEKMFSLVVKEESENQKPA